MEAYIDSVSCYPEYGEISEAFYCFYENAFNSEREFYSSSVEIITLDSLMIFSAKRDSALLLFTVDVTKCDRCSPFYKRKILWTYKENEV